MTLLYLPDDSVMYQVTLVFTHLLQCTMHRCTPFLIRGHNCFFRGYSCFPCSTERLRYCESFGTHNRSRLFHRPPPPLNIVLDCSSAVWGWKQLEATSPCISRTGRGPCIPQNRRGSRLFLGSRRENHSRTPGWEPTKLRTVAISHRSQIQT